MGKSVQIICKKSLKQKQLRQAFHFIKNQIVTSWIKYHDFLLKMLSKIQKIKTCLLWTENVHGWLWEINAQNIGYHEKLWIKQLYRTHLLANERFEPCFLILSVSLQWKNGS